MTEHRYKDQRRVLPLPAVVALLHLLVAWPGAGSRGSIAEEVQPYLHHYPKLLDVREDRAEYSPPNDDAELRCAADEGRSVTPRWVGTNQWPEVAYPGSSRIWPVFVRGHQTAIGTYWGIVVSSAQGHAQRERLREVQARAVPGDAFVTTAYDHTGVLEMRSGEKLRPVHALRMLMAGGVPQDKLVEQRHRILGTQQGECHVLIPRSPSLVAGPFTDRVAVAAALDRTLAVRGASVMNRHVINGDGGGAVFERLEVSSCARSGERRS